MELIRLFYDSLDVKPVVLLNHFLPCIGLYVEEIIGTTKSSKVDSIADIFVVSDSWAGSPSAQTIIPNDKTIIVCKDGWSVRSEKVLIIPYNASAASEEDFLLSLVSCLLRVLQRRPVSSNLLICSPLDVASVLKCVVKAYCKFRILPSMLYSIKFYKQNDLFKIAYSNYCRFIKSLDSLTVSDKNCDLVSFIKAHAKFECNLLCKKNFKCYSYSVKELNSVCTQLIKRYPENEQVRLLQADIHAELEDRKALAGNEYGDVHLSHCAYAQYKRGRILADFAKDYESAFILQQYAMRCKSDYFAALYQLALCFEMRGEFQKSIDALEKICEVLNKKYQNHLLSPIELEYLYKSVLSIVRISKVYLGNYAVANAYEALCDKLLEEAYNTTYLKLFWSDVSPDLIDVICKTLRKNLD